MEKDYYFIVANENDGELVMEKYREAFSVYNRCKGKTTLYKVWRDNSDMDAILAK